MRAVAQSVVRRCRRSAGAAARASDDQLRTIRALVSMLGSAQRRHVGRWLDSLKQDYLLSAPMPWLTFDALDFIDPYVTADSRVFEYGSGGSTLFWLRAGARCTSVEHDGAWFTDMQKRIADGRPVDYRLTLPEPLPPDAADPDPADPHAYGSADPALRRYSFRRYASQIDEFPDGHFDIVLIDGRARPSCVRHSAPKVRPGGILVLDNTERAYYLDRTRRYLQDYTECPFRGAVPSLRHWTATTVFVRNAVPATKQ